MEMLDMNKFKKSTFVVVLKDSKKTKLTLLGQSKEIVDALTRLNNPENTNEEAFACWYQTTALILSRNVEGITVKASEVEKMFDLEEMRHIVDKYDDFNMEILAGKN